MEHCPARLSGIGQRYPERMLDTKSRFWQFGYQSPIQAELICPEPRRATRATYSVDGLSRMCNKTKGIIPMHRGDYDLDILDMILCKDDADYDLDSSNQMAFFCGSPPVRTSNPVVQDVQFAKQSVSMGCPLGNSFGKNQSLARVERGSPSCKSSFGGKPQVRVEGFVCGNSEPQCVVSALA